MPTNTIKPPQTEWLLIRDRINVNNDLKNEMMAEIEFRKIAQGTPVGLIAREIVHDQSFTLRIEGFPLVLVTDFYNGNKGWIDTSGSPGTAGANGATGKPGTAIQNKSKPGERGGDGQPGTRGKSASSITLIAGTVQNALLSALGGPGGAGGTGGTGGTGAAGKTPPRPDKFDAIPPTDGGAGGNGGKAGDGGSGAQITVHYLNLKGLTMNATGGAAGQVGKAGSGGKSGIGTPAAKKGAAGKTGATAATGKSVTPIKAQQQQKQWDAIALEALGKTAGEKWAAYRTRVGEYAFRRHTVNSPKSGDITLREFARNEFLAAKRFGKQTAKAQQFLQYLDSNLTPVGVPYNYDSKPDFEHFEEVVTDYGPWIQTLFSDAHLLLQQTVNTSIKRKQLAIDLEHINGVLAALDLELEAKKQEKQMVLTEIGHTQSQLKANETKIADNRAAQAKQRLEAADDFFYGTVAQVGAIFVAVAAAYVTGGSSLSLLTSAGLLASADSALHQGNGSLSNLFDSSNGKPELKKEFKDLAGGLKETVAGTKDFIDKFKAAQDLMEAKVDGELQNAEKELLIRQLDLTHELNLLDLKRNQVFLETAAINQEMNTTNNDYKLVGQFKDAVQQDIKVLGQIAQALIRQAQSYADILIKYTFYATRSFDVWTLQNQTSKFAFDCGYLHPDEIDHAFQPAARGDGSRVLDLVGKYLPSWSKLPDLIKLRDKYEEYSEDLVTETFFWSFTGQDLPVSLIQHGSATFHTEMPEGRFEAKVLSVAVALVGATANDPSVTVMVEHTGESTVRRLDGQTINISAGSVS